MQRISRIDNRLAKVLIPLLVGGICLGALAAMVSKDGLPWSQVAPVLGVFGAAVVWANWKLQRQMADEIWDAGDRLQVRCSGREESVLMTDILRVESNGLRRSTTVTLHLRDGGKILFYPRPNPPASLYFETNLVADDLRRRVSAAQ